MKRGALGSLVFGLFLAFRAAALAYEPCASGQIAVGQGVGAQPQCQPPATVRGPSALNIDENTTHGDSAYVILATDRVVSTSAALTSPRTWTLPAASAVNAGQELTVTDLFGGVTSTNTLTVARAGSDTIAGATSIALNAPFAGVVLVSDGSSKWSVKHLLMPIALVSHKFLTAFSATTGFSAAQPVQADISDLPMNATNGGSGNNNASPASGRYLKGNGTGFVTSSGSASGTGACGSHTWASTLNSDAAPSCTQPTYTDLTAQPHLNDLQTATGNYAMGTTKLTGLAAGTASGDSTRFEQTVQKSGTQTGNQLVTFSNPTTTEETLFSYSLSGGALGTDGHLSCDFYGDFVNNTGGNQTLSLAFYLGTAKLTATSTAAGTSATGRPWYAHADIFTTGAQNTDSADLWFSYGAANLTGGTGVGFNNGALSGYSQMGIDTSSSQTVKLTGTMSVGTATSAEEIYGGSCRLTPP
jgi:hypothetical protein